MKYCPKCKISKSFTEFYKDSHTNNGLRCYCINCSKMNNKEHPTNNLKRRLTKQAWRKKNPDKAKKERKQTRLRKYGLSIPEYEKLLEIQNNSCAVCNRTETEFKKGLSIDHCHATGKVRGLLCTNCNTAIGALKENPEMFKKALQYLENNRS